MFRNSHITLTKKQLKKDNLLVKIVAFLMPRPAAGNTTQVEIIKVKKYQIAKVSAVNAHSSSLLRHSDEDMNAKV